MARRKVFWVHLAASLEEDGIGRSVGRKLWNAAVCEYCQTDSTAGVEFSKREREEIALSETEREKLQDYVRSFEAECVSTRSERIWTMDFTADRRAGPLALALPEGALLVEVKFAGLNLSGPIASFRGVRFVGTANFDHATIFGDADFSGAQFDAAAGFQGVTFKRHAAFNNALFGGGVTFAGGTFESGASFNAAQVFELATENQDGSARSLGDPNKPLCNFTKVEFSGRTSFRGAAFAAKHPSAKQRSGYHINPLDFSDASFNGPVHFANATMLGVPAFFGVQFKGDVDFSRVAWVGSQIDYRAMPEASQIRAIAVRDQPHNETRAWEALENHMSALGKRDDQHRFFRFRRRAGRKADRGDRRKLLNRVIDGLYDCLCEYGWNVSRALAWWAVVWGGSASVLVGAVSVWTPHQLTLGKTACSSIALAFSYAHRFLFLHQPGAPLNGHLEEIEFLTRGTPAEAVVHTVGLANAIVGPVVLFFLFLTLRNRFRMR